MSKATTMSFMPVAISTLFWSFKIFFKHNFMLYIKRESMLLWKEQRYTCHIFYLYIILQTIMSSSTFNEVVKSYIIDINVFYVISEYIRSKNNLNISKWCNVSISNSVRLAENKEALQQDFTFRYIFSSF